MSKCFCGNEKPKGAWLCDKCIEEVDRISNEGVKMIKELDMKTGIDVILKGDKLIMNEWINVNDRLPELGDYSVLAYFPKYNSIDMVHVEDYFKDITNGVIDGIQQYTKWYIVEGVTHWMELPESPLK
jgi:hypothetical protein